MPTSSKLMSPKSAPVNPRPPASKQTISLIANRHVDEGRLRFSIDKLRGLVDPLYAKKMVTGKKRDIPAAEDLLRQLTAIHFQVVSTIRPPLRSD